MNKPHSPAMNITNEKFSKYLDNMKRNSWDLLVIELTRERDPMLIEKALSVMEPSLEGLALDEVTSLVPKFLESCDNIRKRQLSYLDRFNNPIQLTSSEILEAVAFYRSLWNKWPETALPETAAEGNK